VKEKNKVTTAELTILKAECDRRNFNISQIVALANILPLIGARKTKYSDKCLYQNIELTYCGKSRKEWSRVKRTKLTKHERALKRSCQTN
jgi:hypothetical protein